jgi:predicted dehydrogenase
VQLPKVNSPEKQLMKLLLAVHCAILGLATAEALSADAPPPVRFAIVGLVHGHVHGFLPKALDRSDMQLVGIVEADPKLTAACAARYHLDAKLFFPSIAELAVAAKPQAVAVFTNTFDHQRVVEECAARGIHVMMEKPLAVSMEHARAIQAAVDKSGIRLIVNYETTWYPGNQAAYALVAEQKTIGDLRKIVVHDGHRGPKEIGCQREFVAWLTDPVLNGGGALTDFGCYGADLITWLMHNQRPTSVWAATQQLKPDVYPRVEDEATIVLTYPKTQGIIQASWNWPIARKDMEIYGQTGQVLVPRGDLMRVQKLSGPEKEVVPPPLPGPKADTLSYFAAVVRGEISPSGLSSLETNMIVTEILDAARESARTGRRVDLPVAGDKPAVSSSRSVVRPN